MSGEPNTALDRLEAAVFRQARQELEPDPSRVESLWQSVAAASALAAFGGAGASIPPASGSGWAAPRPITTAPSAAPPPIAEAAPTAESAPTAAPPPTTELAPVLQPGPLEQPGLLQRLGHASFGLRALLGAAVGGAALGFALGYGSGHERASGAGNALDPPAAVTTTASSGVGSSESNAKQAEASEAAAVLGGVELDSLGADAPQVGASAPDRPTTADRLDALSGASTPGASTSGPSTPGASTPGPSTPGASTPGPSTPGASTSGASHSAEEPAEPSFYEELEYLKRAQAALRGGNGALALGLMTSLDSIQPGGALLSERGVIRVLAHCQLGDVEAAQRVAERLATQGLGSVYTERLENSCAGVVFSK